MYWGGFCAFLPDISGLRGGGSGAHSLQESANLRGAGGGGGMRELLGLCVALLFC